MKTVYKYMHSRRGIFFNDFRLKYSLRHELNDPFEILPSNEAFAENFLKVGYFKYGKTKEDILKNMDSPDSSYIPSKHKDYAFDRYGIISFSETYDNLLMWAHYADEHKGMIIGFRSDCTELNTKYNKTWDSKIGKLIRVNYRKYREREFNKHGSIDETFFIKSDDWLYEKEHRIILDIEDADYILAKKETKDTIISMNSDICNWKEIVINDEHFYRLDSAKKLSGTLHKHEGIMYFITMSPESIDSVFLGARMDKLEKDKIIELIHKNENMKNCKIYNSVISNCRFELNFLEVK